MKIQFLPDFFKANNGILTGQQLREAGYTYYQLNNLMQSDLVIKLKQGLYKWNDSGQHEQHEVAKMVPNGVFCLFTACQHYELTTFVSSEYHLAIPIKSKVVLPLYPPIKLYYWTQVSYATGIVQVSIDGTSVKMYDPEKTVCDMIRLRNKIGMDTVKEVEKNYIKRKDRNLSKLTRYARELGVQKYIMEHLSLLL